MKKLFFTSTVFCFLSVIHAQYSYQDINSQLVNKNIGSIASDEGGNTIVTGTFRTTIFFGNYTLTNNAPDSNSTNDAFIAKQDINGNWLWAKKIGIPTGATWPGNAAWINKVISDATGNVYITGGFMGTITLDNVTLTSHKLQKVFTADIFTAKLSSNGNFLWAKAEGTGLDNPNDIDEQGQSVTVDNAGNVYTTGFIIQTTYKNISCSWTTTGYSYAIYAVKYNSSGAKIWEKNYINSLASASTACNINSLISGQDIKCDGISLYLTGNIFGSVNFGNNNVLTPGNTYGNSYLLKLDGNGNTVWAKSVTNNNNKGVYLLLDNNGSDIYMSGFFTGTISFGTVSLTTNPRINSSYLAKYSSSGNVVWVINPGRGGSGRLFKHPNGQIGIDETDSITSFHFTIKEFSPSDGSLTNATTASAANQIADIISTPGGYVFSQNLKGSYDFGGITISSTQATTSNYSDMILMKYITSAPSIARTTNITTELTSSDMILYPNPAMNQITIRNKNNKILGKISIYDADGRILIQKYVSNPQTAIDVQQLTSGVYYLKVEQTLNAIKFLKQ